jgi:CubicO group peptidase (beta-lactamase class C family)
VARFAHLRPSTEIRQVMQYNNFHYWILAEIVSHITQIPYPEFVKTHILDPVGMSHSTYNHTKAEETGHRAESFVRADQNYTRCAEVWAQEDKLDRSCYGQPFQAPWFTRGDGLFIAGCGGLVSSANDMVSCRLLT